MRLAEWANVPAFKLVMQDKIKAESYQNQKQWVARWSEADRLYAPSPASNNFWPGTSRPRSDVPSYRLADAVNSLAPKIVGGLYYKEPPFDIQKRPGTQADAARAAADLLAWQLEQIGFREELRLGIINVALYGTCVWKWGWETYQTKRRYWERKKPDVEINLTSPTPGAAPSSITDGSENTFEEVEVDENVDQPFFVHITDIRDILVDPSLNVPDIRKAKYVIYRRYVTWEELDEMRERPGYNIPSREELLDVFFTPNEQVPAPGTNGDSGTSGFDFLAVPATQESTANPFEKPLELLERWDGKTMIAVLQQKVVIASTKNDCGSIPFLSVNWWDVPKGFYGMGLGRLVGALQRAEYALTNGYLDNVALNINGVYVREMGVNVPTQNISIYPGKIVNVEKGAGKDGFKPLERLPAIPEVGEFLSRWDAQSEQYSGASSASTQGIAGRSGHSNMARSSAGAQILGAGSDNRTDDFIDKIADQVIEPFLYAAHDMNTRMLPPDTIKYILNEELQHAFMSLEADHVLDIKNARMTFSILAAAKRAARRNLAQALPIMLQYLGSQAVTDHLAMAGQKVNFTELVKMMFEVAEAPNFGDVIQPMTPQDTQRWQMSQPAAVAAAKGQAQVQAQGMKQRAAQELEDQKTIGRAADSVIRHAIETSASPLEINGEPGGQGFGANL